ncbi:MAG: hypothetical protein RL177_692, partial [Bacteroidota bacterium]
MKSMNTIFLSVVLIALSAGTAMGQFTTNWSRSAAGANLPSWFSISSAGSTERGFAYGVVGGNERIYVASRKGGNSVLILNANTGEDVGTLDVTTGGIISGGTFAINDVEVTEDGIIFVGNGAATGAFKLYKWTSEGAAPALELNVSGLSPSVRVGDKFTIKGNYSQGTAELYLASAAATAPGNGVVFKFTMSGGVFNSTPQVIILSDNASGGSASVDVNGNVLYFNAGSHTPKRYTVSGTAATISGTVSSGTVTSGSNAIRYIGTVG